MGAHDKVKYTHTVEEHAEDLRRTLAGTPVLNIEYAAVVGKISGTRYGLSGEERLAEIDRILAALKIVQNEQSEQSGGGRAL